MAQQVRRRRQRTIQFDANNVMSEPLGRGMVYREIHLKLHSRPTCAATANTEANIERGGEWGVVKRIELIANNTDVIRSLSGNALRWLNYFWFHQTPHFTAALGDAATANPVLSSTLILPLWQPNSLRPMDTALDARELSDLKIQITWGDYDDISAGASAWTTEPYMEVHSLESFLVEGPFSQWRIYTIEQAITAANAQMQVQLPVGPMYRGFMMITHSDTIEVGTILNNFKIISGTTVFADVPEYMLAQIDNLRVGNLRTWDDAGHAFDEIFAGDDNALAGVYFYDHVTDGYLTEAIDTLGFSEFMLELDVNAPGATDVIQVYPMQIIPVRGQ